MMRFVNNKFSWCLLLMQVFLLSASAQTLQQRLTQMADSFPGEVGISLFTPQGDTVSVNADKPFPLLSVVKFHQALAVCNHLRHNHASLDKRLSVRRRYLHADTWSPLRDQYPKGGRFPISKLLEYTLIQSDNNACDILFKKCQRASRVNQYIRGLGIRCNIRYNEDEMHRNIYRCYDNASTPAATNRLLSWFFQNKDRDEYSRFVWSTMSQCQTGASRIPKYIFGDVAAIIHKTGTGAQLPDGRIMAVNDAACILLPDGRHYFLSVFIRDASCSLSECEELIAQISKNCFESVR